MYKVVKDFADLLDDCYEYAVGDTYPRKGLEVSTERVAELSGCENKHGTPIIKEVKKRTTKK